MAKKQQTQAKAHERALGAKKRGGKKDMNDIIPGDDSEKQVKKPSVDPTPSEPSKGGYKPGDAINPGY